ncbi:hypothetical protein HMPREF1868_00703 [Olsenella sp. DNF00959]|nr:hypothetical protein HMPREF1868_00703 [Olsenella sp. DNF00959]
MPAAATEGPKNLLLGARIGGGEGPGTIWNDKAPLRSGEDLCSCAQ